MKIEKYINFIEGYFPYLFNEYGFKIVYKNEYRPNYGWFCVGLESKQTRLLFLREQGAGTIFLGPLSANFSSDAVDSNWVNLVAFSTYLLNEEWNWDFLNNLPYTEQISASFEFYSSKMKPLCTKMFKMFETQESINQWKQNYDKYLLSKFQDLS